MAKPLEKMKALALRREGASIKEIAKKVGVSPDSVSKWTRDIELTESQRTYLYERQIALGHKGRMVGAEMNRRKRLESLRLAKEAANTQIKELDRSSLFYVGLGLYWGEGSKAGYGSVVLTNSDSTVIRLMLRWFRECFGVGEERFQPRVFISDVHRDREEVLIEFWSRTLKLPREQFRKTVFLDKGRKIYENRDTYYGVLALRVAKSTDIRYRILAQIARVADLLPG